MDLLIIAAIVWFIRQAVIDAKYAALGKTPPRYQLKMAQLAAAGKKTTLPTRYGSKDYFADLWADALQAQTEKRRAKAAAKESTAGDAVTPVASTESRGNENGNGVVVDDEPAVTERHVTEPVHVGPGAQIIPMFSIKKEVPVMNVSPASEVTGLQSAIAYADAVADAHEQHSLAGGEAYIGSLESFNVTGQTIQLVAAAQEASANAAAAWTAASVALAKQLSVKEAYDSNPDAGTQAFVQGE